MKAAKPLFKKKWKIRISVATEIKYFNIIHILETVQSYLLPHVCDQIGKTLLFVWEMILRYGSKSLNFFFFFYRS